jgi:murein DD-endopeptidase MepM/ murein hydrolase activator NlpD
MRASPRSKRRPTLRLHRARTRRLRLSRGQVSVLLGAVLCLTLFGSLYWRGEGGVEEGPIGGLAIATEEPADTLSGRIERRETLSDALDRSGVERRTAHEIFQALEGVFDFRTCRRGDTFTLVLDDEGVVEYFEYRSGLAAGYVVEKSAAGLRGYRCDPPVARRHALLSGMLDTSLYIAMLDLGHSPELVSKFSDIFAWDIDFHTESREGDRFAALYEQLFSEGRCIGYGDIICACYSGRQEHYAFRYVDPEGHADYYDETGRSLRKAFLRSPLSYSRISSFFSLRRYHPILKRYRPHYGIDYVAPRGSPVSAIGDGVVEFAGWKGGYGRFVQLRHANDYLSGYGHLSRIAPGVHKGARIAQGVVIGYVGSTGLSTGPHLHFEMAYKGRFVDPLRVNLPAANPVRPEFMNAFVAHRDTLMAILSQEGGIAAAGIQQGYGIDEGR